jgi:kumamolisin
MTSYRLIPGSHRHEFPDDDQGPYAPNTPLRLTLALAPDSKPRHRVALTKLAESAGLRFEAAQRQSIMFSGTVAAVQRTFQVQLRRRGRHRCRSGPYSVPATFGSNVVAVLGLDTRPQVRYHHHIHKFADSHAGFNGYMAPTVAGSYGFPPQLGRRHSVGIVEFGGAYDAKAMRWYFQHVNIQRTPNVTTTGQQHPRQTNASVEVMLDAEIIATLVPNALTKLYFYPNTTAGFYNALAAAVQTRHDAVSISWGAIENQWTPASMTAINNLAQSAGQQGTTICAASGDSGSSDGQPGLNVDFPGSAPYILGCGGTKLLLSGSAYESEIVWNSASGATGGGLSEFFAIPDYQAAVASGNNMRMVPDVAANADPNTGFLVRLNGQSMAVGGTSAAAPLWAALVCRLNQALGRKLGFVHPALYSLLSGSLRDITSGNNGAWEATAGFDLCTGLGTPPNNLASLLQ